MTDPIQAAAEVDRWFTEGPPISYEDKTRKVVAAWLRAVATLPTSEQCTQREVADQEVSPYAAAVCLLAELGDTP